MSLAVVGHNNPPGPIEYIQSVMTELSDFLTETPVIRDAKDVAKGGIYVERMRKHLADVEAERDGKVRPLNEQVAAINAEYKAVHNTDAKKPGTADKLLIELRQRLTDYAKAEEAERTRQAQIARQAAEEAERIAREAEQAEMNAKANAAEGELVNVGAAISTADATFAEFERASREAARAEHAVPVRIGSAMGGKSIGMRTTEALVLESYNRAIKAIGPNEKIHDAVLSAARDFRKLKGALPDGVTATYERKI